MAPNITLKGLVPCDCKRVCEEEFTRVCNNDYTYVLMMMGYTALSYIAYRFIKHRIEIDHKEQILWFLYNFPIYFNIIFLLYKIFF